LCRGVVEFSQFALAGTTLRRGVLCPHHRN
jgi:hypothetical protein